MKTHPIGSPGPRRVRGTAAALSLLVVFGLLGAACGDDGDDDDGTGVAAVDTTATTASDSSEGTQPTGESPDAVAYSRCMRDHGVPGFPDPNADGEHVIDASQLGVPLESPQLQAAEEACADLLPRRSAEQRAEDYEARLEYAQCMRDEGITGFEDPPPPSSGPNTESNNTGQQQDLGFDPESAQFQAAHEACADFLPDDGEEPSLSERPGG